MSINTSFAGKRVLVTGGAQGIGRQLVQRFHEGGAVVFTIDKNPESLAKLKNELPEVNTSVVDLSDWEETKIAVEKLGPIDYLVNNAGIIMPANFLDVTESSLSKMFAVNVGAFYNVSQVVANDMIDRGVAGCIVNVSSICGRFHYDASYGPMKAAVENLTKSMAVELMPHNIRVNCILPGIVDTPMTANLPPELARKKEMVTEKMIGKRGIKPDEIADLVIFLLSPLSVMITGQGIVIDGGYLAS